MLVYLLNKMFLLHTELGFRRAKVPTNIWVRATRKSVLLSTPQGGKIALDAILFSGSKLMVASWKRL